MPTSSAWRWAGSAVLVVLVGAVLLLLRDPRFFFHGDTQSAYLGWEFRLGRQLRGGHWPLLDPHAWAAGNAAAEGQWGLFSPLVMAIGLLVSVSTNVLVLVTGVKLVLLSFGVVGTFLLARSYGANAPLSFVAAVVAPSGGVTQYLDLPSWMASLMIWALLPWVWWALRRTTLRGANPAPVLALAYLLVSVGYVYGTIMLILVLVVSLAEARVRRDRVSGLRTLGVGVVSGLVAGAVYLPGVLTAPVTMRSGSGLEESGKFASDAVALFTSMLPTAAAPGVTHHLVPYAYVGWFLPVIVLLVDWRAVRRHWRPVAGPVVMVVVMVLVAAFAPARLGPIRWPTRLEPFLVQAVVVLAAALVSRHVVDRPSRRRLALVLGWVALAGVVAGLRAPSIRTGTAVGVLLVALLSAAAWWWAVRRPAGGLRLAALAAAGVTLALGGVQHGFFPAVPSPERNMPALARDYLRPLPGARGDVVVVGDTNTRLKDDPAFAAEALSGSAWYLSGHPVQNTYTTISFRAFHERYCFAYEGSTCPAVLDALFSTEPTTGMLRVDLLAVSTLMLVREDFPGRNLAAAPGGWRVTASTPRTVTWVRTHPVPGAGRPVWSSPRTSVRVISADDRTVRFATRAPAGGGRVLLSRLAWPGYHVDGGEVGTSVDGYLLTVEVPAGAHAVTVRFSPPGWPVEVASWWLAVVGASAWVVGAAFRSRWRSRR